MDPYRQALDSMLQAASWQGNTAGYGQRPGSGAVPLGGRRPMRRPQVPQQASGWQQSARPQPGTFNRPSMSSGWQRPQASYLGARKPNAWSDPMWRGA